MKKGYIYSLKRVLEFTFIITLAFKLIDIGFYFMNQANSLVNIGGLVIVIASLMSFIFYIINFGERIRNYLDI